MPVGPDDPRLSRYGFARLMGQDLDFFVQKYEIVMGRRSKSTFLDVILGQGDNMNISRQHAKIMFNFDRGQFELVILGKNGVTVNGVLHTPSAVPVPLESQDLLQIGDRSFYFLLPKGSTRPNAKRRRVAPKANGLSSVPGQPGQPYQGHPGEQQATASSNTSTPQGYGQPQMHVTQPPAAIQLDPHSSGPQATGAASALAAPPLSQPYVFPGVASAPDAVLAAMRQNPQAYSQPAPSAPRPITVPAPAGAGQLAGQQQGGMPFQPALQSQGAPSTDTSNQRSGLQSDGASGGPQQQRPIPHQQGPPLLPQQRSPGAAQQQAQQAAQQHTGRPGHFVSTGVPRPAQAYQPTRQPRPFTVGPFPIPQPGYLQHPSLPQRLHAMAAASQPGSSPFVGPAASGLPYPVGLVPAGLGVAGLGPMLVGTQPGVPGFQRPPTAAPLTTPLQLPPQVQHQPQQVQQQQQEQQPNSVPGAQF